VARQTGRAFDAAVLAVVSTLPPGVVATYGEVAVEAGYPGAARAVGRVLRETTASVPWWRVIRADGRLAGPVAEAQGRRLAAEGVGVCDGRVLRPTGAGSHGATVTARPTDGTGR
jgi:methylated-DNA-protein-cysteine methyltransferase-like protein